MPPSQVTGRRAVWQDLYTSRLPQLALAKDPVQKKWPVTLDHCFGRIILDKVIGQGQAPWTGKLKGPAIKNMSDEQVEKCIELGEQIVNGNMDLVRLDEESLKARGKTSKEDGKRKREAGETQKSKRRKPDDADVLREVDVDRNSKNPSQGEKMDVDSDKTLAAKAQKTDSMAQERRLIEASSLADYRKKVLLVLCQVPKGKYTTYAAISEFLKSSPRAVGNAMRNNPFAPAVPCHRVLAADGKIGGYGGQWGEGNLVKTKRDLLREEGLKFDGTGRVVGGPFKDFK